MEIPEKLLKHKYKIIFTLTIFLILISLIYVAPSFVTVLAYFWPLFLSTALFLVAVLFFGNTNSLQATDTSSDKPPGEGILDYVAGLPEQAVENFKSE